MTAACALLGLGAMIVLLMGRYPSPGFTPIASLRSDPLAAQILVSIRLPRTIAAALVGASLAGAGHTMQMLFANPLVEPGIMGVSQGAAFGAALAMVLGTAAALPIQGAATLGGIVGLALTHTIARRIRYGGWILRLVLAGIAVSAIFSAGLGLVKYLADPLEDLPEITFWLLGGLWSVGWERLLPATPAMVLGIAVPLLGRWRLNALALGDRVAFSLGSVPVRERRLFLFASSVAVAAAISIAGIVSWVGLIVPHISRRIAGSNTEESLPLSLAMGALFVMGADAMGRTIVAGEIPLGLITSLLGAVGFVVLLSARGARSKP